MFRSNRSKKQCVLAIDDEESSLALIKVALKREGITVYTASSAKEGIKLYRDYQQDIGVILLDYLLPEMSGEWIFENLRCINPEVRIVLLTGCEKSVADRMLKRGLWGYLKKPIGLPELVEKVQEAINYPVLASPVSQSLAGSA